jgi:hypothetical protein
MDRQKLPDKVTKNQNYTWSNLNIAEVLPGINPPLVTSTMIDIFSSAARETLQISENVPLMRDIKGRLYLNLTVLEQRIVKIIKTDNFSITNFLGGAQKNRESFSNISLLLPLISYDGTFLPTFSLDNPPAPLW